MLLDLLDHHHELFLTAIKPLICARGGRELASLAITCRKIREFLVAEVPLLAHIRKFKATLGKINAIEKIICVDADYNYSSIVNLHGRIICYVLYRITRRLYLYNHLKHEVYTEISDIAWCNIADFELCPIDMHEIHGRMRKFINKHVIPVSHEKILDAKLNAYT
jgi:hypothetical protein